LGFEEKLSWHYLSHRAVERAISSQCDNYFICDFEYKTVDYLSIQSLFEDNVGRFIRYRKDIYDCDDFALTASMTLRILYGNVAVGMAAIRFDNGGAHMLNFVVTPSGDIVYVEPQTNKLVLDENFKPYFMFI